MEILNINSKREELISPLLKWRILGTEELGELSSYIGNIRNLKKIILRSEKDGILKSFVHKFNNRKFIHLTRSAHHELSDGPWNVNEEIKHHDAIVSSVLYRFSKLDFVSLSKINYQDIRFNQSIFSHGVDPDGMIRATRKDKTYNIAIEIELTRKNSTEIMRKFKLYNENTSYTWAIYFFSNIKVLGSYFKYYKQFMNEIELETKSAQIMFCYSGELASSNLNPLNCYWLRPDGVDSTLKELFI